MKENTAHDDDGDKDDDDAVNNVVVAVPAPLLLLDEWLDKETSGVIQSVQDALVRLVDATGAVVISITHKPERWRRIPSITAAAATAATAVTPQPMPLMAQMTLRQGKVVQLLPPTTPTTVASSSSSSS